MKVNTTGITRTVFIFKEFVIKIPKIRYGWYYFLLGLCGNIEENKCWKITKSDLLCPVKWCSWGGWILIMQRADVERWVKDSEGMKWGYVTYINAGFGGDDKPDNYGYIGNRLVKIDYPNFTDKSINKG